MAGTFQPPASFIAARDFYFDKDADLIYMTVDGGSLAIVDVSDPENMSQEGSTLSRGALVNGMVPQAGVQGDYCYMPFVDHLRIADVSDPSSMGWTWTSATMTDNGHDLPNQAVMHDDVLYVGSIGANTPDFITTWDVSAGTSAVRGGDSESDSDMLSGARTFAIIDDGDYLLAGFGLVDDALFVFDLRSDPLAPTILDKLTTGIDIRDGVAWPNSSNTVIVNGVSTNVVFDMNSPGDLDPKAYLLTDNSISGQLSFWFFGPFYPMDATRWVGFGNAPGIIAIDNSTYEVSYLWSEPYLFIPPGPRPYPELQNVYYLDGKGDYIFSLRQDPGAYRGITATQVVL